MERASDSPVLHRLNQHNALEAEEVDQPAHGRLIAALTTLAALR